MLLFEHPASASNWQATSARMLLPRSDVSARWRRARLPNEAGSQLGEIRLLKSQLRPWQCCADKPRAQSKALTWSPPRGTRRGRQKAWVECVPRITCPDIVM